MAPPLDGGFHHSEERADIPLTRATIDGYQYTFDNFFHPFVADLIAELNIGSLASMLDPTFLDGLQQRPASLTYFTDRYDVVPSPASPSHELNSTGKTIDVSPAGPYANYNWELMYHIPIMVAVHLSKNQRFAEAQKWFHLVFDPTSNDSTISGSARYWRFLGFRTMPHVKGIEGLFTLLSTPDAQITDADLKNAKKDFIEAYRRSVREPFKPHVVAGTRPLAYQYYVVMKYLDNLIAWGDSLFLQDTVETINEATLCYVLASNLLGPRPQSMQRPGKRTALTFAQLKQRLVDSVTGNALVDLENLFPFYNPKPPAPGGTSPASNGPLFGIGRELYFCVPRNTKLLAYWDTVADRLFKVRHCQNLAGVARPLALFDPALDPGMLVKAVAAGIDLGSIVAGLNPSPGPLRAPLLIQKALEICAETRSLGSALLAALEKRDAEQLTLVRQGHEIALQKLSKEVRFLQWKQTQQATESLLRTRASAVERYKYYLRLLGQSADSDAVPDTFGLDRRPLTEATFDDAFKALVTAYDKPVALHAFPQLRLAGSQQPDNQSGASSGGQLYLNASEHAELNTHLPKSRDLRRDSSVADTLASVLVFIPECELDVLPIGLGGHSKLFGGSKLSIASKIAADILRTQSAWEQDQATMAGRIASYQRRVDDWILQANLAARELVQLGKQLLASLIAEQVAQREYKNVEEQIKQSQEVNQLLLTKFTSADFYAWMQGEVFGLYYQYYRFAFDIARKAERTMKLELMQPDLDATSYVQFNYWDKGRQGLLSAEALYLDLKRMERAYQEYNRRELELTRSISLRQLDPLALLRLTVTGSCDVSIPEWFYDRDCPGHFLRRIKSVAVSVPCIAGPYASVNVTLTLQKSEIRVKALLLNGKYGRSKDNRDPRFVDHQHRGEQVVTSGASNDSGMFETNLRDERFLPFEGAGAISTWGLQLPALPQFDYMSITDVILHMRYTARVGGDALGEQATRELAELLKQADADYPQALLLSLRSDFPAAWASLSNNPAQPVAFTLRLEHFPYLVQSGTKLTITGMRLHWKNGAALVSATPPNVDLAQLSASLNENSSAEVRLTPAPLTQPLPQPLPDVFLILAYSVDPTLTSE